MPEQQPPFLLPENLSDDLSRVRWIFAGNTPFLEPFFDETLSRLRYLPENQVKPWPETGTEAMDGLSGTVPVAAVIFHVSRCGSTLLSQLLSRFPRHIVLSEVPFLDQVLRKSRLAQAGTPAVQALLRAAVAAYTRRRAEAETQAFLKTDSWHLFFYEYYRALYPDVPFVLLFRHPSEVVASQQKRRGIHAVPGLVEAELFGLDAEQVVHLPLDVYMAQVLESYYTAMLDIARRDNRVLLVNYEEGALAMMQQLASGAGLSFSPEEWAGIAERAGFHAKYPGQAFTPDTPAADVPDYLVRAAALYRELDQVRLSRAGAPG